MRFKNREGYMFFAWVCIVQLWGASATAITEKQYRYIPIAVMGLALCVAFIYAMTKVNDIKTLDEKLFKQANMLFYISCLIAAVDNKKQWRNAHKGIDEVIAYSSELGPQYLAELLMAKQWRLALHSFKTRAGYLAYFDDASLAPSNDSKISQDTSTQIIKAEELKNAITKQEGL
jgi:hypothetical protein